jgi:hypothetical protein
LDVFPISIWQISLQQSVTNRFYETKTIDCTVFECGGIAHRGTFKTSLALGYGEFFLVPSFSLTDLALSSDKKNFASEEDNLIAERDGDQLAITQIALGYKRGDWRWVALQKSSKMKLTGEYNSTQYLIVSRALDAQWNYFVGGGLYSSSHVERNASIVAGVSWAMGENLSLF